MENPLVKLEQFGQSIWLDNISREILQNGTLKKLVDEDGLKGVTSNPTIFQKAISGGTHYDEQLNDFYSRNPEAAPFDAFVEVAVKDIQDAADILKTVYDKTNGKDGY